MHRGVQHKCTIALCAGDWSLHWRGTTTWAENGLFTFRYHWKGQKRVASGAGYKRTGQSPLRISANRQKAGFLMCCKYVLVHSTNVFSFTHPIQSNVHPLKARFCNHRAYFKKGGKPAPVIWLKCRSGQGSGLETSPANTYLSNLQMENVTWAGFEISAEQTGLIDDQRGLALMRPCCPGPRPVQPGQEFLLTAPRSLIMFAFPPLGIIVGFNYFATKWYRWKIGVCN